jgi:hypothetical protein
MGTESNGNREEEVRALTQVLEILQHLGADARDRIMQMATTFFSDASTGVLRRNKSQPPVESSSDNSFRPGPFSEDRSISPKQFVLEKQPKTDVERVACLAYYLTHYRDTPHFKTLDISKLNTDAAQVKFSNAAVAVENATKMAYLVPATKGSKQISSLGEQFVLALPDREKAKAAMAHARPRRKTRKSSSASEVSQS